MIHTCHRAAHARYCDAVADEIARFATAVRGADGSIAVATCPGWALTDVVRHVGRVHRWAAAMVRQRAAERIDPRRLELDLPDDATPDADWLAAGGVHVVEAFRDVDPDAPMWAWGADQHARFWPRRMLHETVVHRADAELALGREPAVSSQVAVDGIDELLDNLPHAVYFAPQVAELRGDGESLHLHCTDTDGEWMIGLRPDGFGWEHAHGKGTVAVRGTAADLLLLAYGRRPPDDTRFEVFGDAALLARWLEHSAL
jgi:uncharacterized protein (TIGR03083 family)